MFGRKYEKKNQNNQKLEFHDWILYYIHKLRNISNSQRIHSTYTVSMYSYLYKYVLDVWRW